jgi:hypothetical protein
MRKMASVELNGLPEIFTRVKSQIIKKMDTVAIFGRMELIIKDNLKMISSMALV